MSQYASFEEAKPQSMSIVPKKNNKMYHLFNFLEQEYGNDVETMLKRVNGILASGIALNLIKDERLRKTLKFIQSLISLGVLTMDLSLHLNHYFESQKKQKIDKCESREDKYLKILELDSKSFKGNGTRLNIWEYGKMNSEIVTWVLNSPKTSNFRVLKYFDYYSLSEIECVTFEEDKSYSIVILIEYEGKKLCWEIEFSIYSGTPLVKNSCLIGTNITEDLFENFKNRVLLDYITILDITKNTMVFDDFGWITPIPRRNITEKINQFDVDTFVKEIKQVLDNKRRRAFAFVGKQGVGKSIIMRKIETVLTDYIIIHLSSRDFAHESTLINRFSFIKTLQPVIVIIDDLDSCNLQDKNRITGEFLSCIDDVNKDLNMVLIVSINDTSSVHYTILNRPGRFDRVFEITTPRTLEEIYEILESKIKSVQDNYCKVTLDLNKILKRSLKMNNTLKKFLKHKLTQAEITNAIVEQAFIDININFNPVGDENKWLAVDDKIFSTYLNGAFKKHETTKKSLSNCNFHKEDPTINKCEETKASKGDSYSMTI
jgi:hypothetical protein